MASDDVGLSPSLFMIVPNTKRHPNNTKTDQLPISEAITGLPRPYHKIVVCVYICSVGYVELPIVLLDLL